MCLGLVKAYRGFPKLRVPFGGPNDKDYSILGLHWGSPILGNYHIRMKPTNAKLSEERAAVHSLSGCGGGVSFHREGTLSTRNGYFFPPRVRGK